MAQKAADTARRTHATIVAHRQDARLGMLQRQVTLKRRRPTAQQIVPTEAVLAIKDQAERDGWRVAGRRSARVLWLAKLSETVTVPVQAVPSS